MSSYFLCKESALPVGSAKVIKVGGETVLLFHLEEGFYATQSHCTHLFMPLKKGKILDGCRLQCPFHRAEFDIRTGEVERWACFPPGIQVVNTLRTEKALKTYSVEVKEGDVYVDLSLTVEPA